MKDTETKLPNDRKLNGAYYTPDPLARLMVDWALPDPRSNFFDPCFGKGIFIIQAFSRYKELGLKDPWTMLHGVDIDDEMVKNLTRNIPEEDKRKHFVSEDFLKLRPSIMKDAPFDAICCNPPFIRHHYLTKDKLSEARSALKQISVEVSGKASYWLYFLFHCTSFLKRGGRLAILVPTSFIYAEYSKRIRESFLGMFRDILIVSINGLLFDDALQTVLMVLAEGYGIRNEYVGFTVADSIGSVKESMARISGSRDNYRVFDRDVWGLNLLSRRAKELLDELMQTNKTLRLGDVAQIKIGVVTGANSFFVLPEIRKKESKIPARYFKPIITRATSIRGIGFTKKDFNALQEKNRSYLLVLDGEPRNNEIRRYLKKGIKQKTNKGYHCRRRENWYAVEYGEAPDAFLHYMSDGFPHIVVNQSGYTSTNAIHRIVWSRKLSNSMKRAFALASLSSLAQVSAELFGRSYGGGILKLEPSEARRLVLPASGFEDDIDKAFYMANALLIDQNKEKASEIADQIFLERFLGLDADKIDTIRKYSSALRNARKRNSVTVSRSFV